MIQTKTLLNQARYGYDFGVGWYQRAELSIYELAEYCRTTASRMALLLSAYSPRVQVIRSVRMAIEICLTGQRPTGCLRMAHESAMRGLERGYLTGPKTEAFRRALLGDDSALVLDTWVCKGLRIDQSKAYQKRFLPKIMNRFESVSETLGLSIAQVQACQWVGVMRAFGRQDVDLIPAGSAMTIFDSVKERVQG